MASAGGIRMGKVFVEIGADASKFFAAVDGINRQVGKIGASMSKVGTQIMTAGAAMAAPVILATRQFAKFDDAIRATAAVTGSLGPQGAAAFAMLNDKARELGATTSFTAIEVANLMTELGRAGFKPDEINSMTGAVLDLARATGTDATRSAGIMAATLRQFGLNAGDAARAADVLTYAANSTFNTVDGLGESLKYAGPVAKSLGMSLEDTVSVLGALGNVGIQGSEAGTALRRLGVISAGAGEKLQELFGVSNVDAAGNLKPLVDILDEINTATKEMDVADRTARMAKAFGLLGITSANVLSGSADSVRALRDGMASAEGVAAKTAKAMDGGLGGAMRIAMSAVEGTALAIGDALAPSMISAINFLERASTAATSFVKANSEMIVSVAGGVVQATAFGAALLVVGKGLSLASSLMGTIVGVAGAAAKSLLGVATALGGILFSTAAAIIKVAAYGAANVAAAAASAAAWAVANVAMVGQAVFLGLIVEALFRALGGYELLGDAVSGVTQAGRDAVGVLAQIGEVGSQAFQSIYESINAGNLEGAMSVALSGLQNAFQLFSTNFMNTVDEWGVNLVNAFDYWISQIPFLRFAGPDKFKFSLFGDSTDPNDTADTRAMGRLGNLTTRQTERNTKLQNAAAGFQADVAVQRNKNILANQGNDVIAGLADAKTMADLRSAAEEFFLLKDAGGISAEQEKRYQEAVDAATDRITPTGTAPSEPKRTPVVDQDEEDRKRRESQILANAAAAAAAARSAETAGTFSSVGLGGMGYGSSLAEKQLEELKKIAKNTEEIGDEGAVAA